MKSSTLSLFYNNNFVNDKVNLSTGVSYIKDIVYGKSPSAFINAKYNGKAFSTFFNSSWYNYSVGSLSNNTLTFEVGVTRKFTKNHIKSRSKRYHQSSLVL